LHQFYRKGQRRAARASYQFEARQRSRDAWQISTDEVSAADEVAPEQIQKAEQAYKDYIRASKEYLAIAFKKKFLER